jgi:hypothetical protein
MTGKSHLAANGAVCLAVGADPVFIAGAVICAKLPDQAEFFMPWVKHRTVTHHLYFWLGATAFFLFFPVSDAVSGVDPAVGMLLAGGFFGGLWHVTMDMFSKSGIPLYPGKVWGARVYTTGKYSEYLFLGVFILICGVALMIRNPQQIAEALKNFGS